MVDAYTSVQGEPGIGLVFGTDGYGIYGTTTRDEIELLAPIFDSATQSTTYYDAKKGTNVTMSTYSGDWEITYKKMKVGEAFNCSLIARNPR